MATLPTIPWQTGSGPDRSHETSFWVFGGPGVNPGDNPAWLTALSPPPPVPPPKNTGTGTGTGTDPLSTLSAAYMASLAGGGGSGGYGPTVVPAAPDTGTGINWTMVGALAALALVGWAVWTWWKGRHKK